jgi:hypothetical protein
VASAVTKYLPEDGLLYATAVSFVKPVCSSNRWRRVYLAASPDCVIKINANVSVNLNGGDEIHHKSYQLDSKLNKISLKADKAIKITTIIILIVIIKIILPGRCGVAANSNISSVPGYSVDRQARRHRRMMTGNNNKKYC